MSLFTATWQPEQRATRNCIRFHIARALEKKAWAEKTGDDWRRRSSTESNRMLDEYLSASVHQLARYSLDYMRLRAARNLYGGEPFKGYPVNRPERENWDSLQGRGHELIAFYSFADSAFRVCRFDNPKPLAGKYESAADACLRSRAAA